MVRIIESAEDEERGWGVKKSPYEYDSRPTQLQTATQLQIPTQLQDSIQDSVQDSVQDSIQDSVQDSIQDSVQDSVQDSIQDSVQDSRLRDSLARQPRPIDAPKISDSYTPKISRNPQYSLSHPKAQRVIEGIPNIPMPGEVMESLVPIGDTGFYSVPDDAAAPGDCDRWPDSPACSGQPLTNVPVGFEDLEVINDVCNRGVGFTPVLGFIKLPKIQFVYRNKECRILPPDKSPRREWDIYQLPPGFQGISMPDMPQGCIPEGEDFICFVGVQYHQRSLYRSVSLNPLYGNVYTQSALKITPKLYPPQPGTEVRFLDRTNPQYSYLRVPMFTCKYDYAYETQEYVAEVNVPAFGGKRRSGEKTYNNSGNGSGKHYADQDIDYLAFDEKGWVEQEQGRFWTYNYDYNVRVWGTGQNYYRNVQILYGQYSNIAKYLRASNTPRIIRDTFSHGYGDSYVTYHRIDVSPQVVWMNVDGETIIPEPCTNKPPDKRRKRCCMGCCPPSPGDDSILRLLLQKVTEVEKDVEDLKKKIGDPVDVKYHEEKNTDEIKKFGFDSKNYKPDTLFKAAEFAVNRVDYINKQLIRLKENNAVLQPKEFIDAKIPKRILYPAAKGEEKVRGFADVLKCMILQVDRGFGAWPIDIKIADANAGKEGSQPVTLKIQSISNALQTLIESALDVNADVDTSTNMQVRMAYELMAIHQISAVNNQHLQNLEDAFGYKVRHIKLDLPLAFNPNGASDKGFEKGGKGNIDAKTEEETEKLLPKLLTETIYPVKATEYDGKKDLNESLLELLHHVLTISGTTTVPYKGPGALKQLIESAVFAQKAMSHIFKQDVQEAMSGGNLDRVLKEIEQGYETIAPDRTENVSPYNKPSKERPRAKRVSKRKNDKKTEPPTPPKK